MHVLGNLGAEAVTAGYQAILAHGGIGSGELFPEFGKRPGDAVIHRFAHAEAGGIELCCGAGQGGGQCGIHGSVHGIVQVILRLTSHGGEGQLSLHALDGEFLADAVQEIAVFDECQPAHGSAVVQGGLLCGGEYVQLHLVAIFPQGGVACAVAYFHGGGQVAAVPAGHGGGREGTGCLFGKAFFLILRQLLAQYIGMGTQCQLVLLVIAHPYLGDELRGQFAHVHLRRIAELVAAAHGKLDQSLGKRAVRLAVEPVFRKVIGCGADGHEEHADILGQGTQQDFRAVGQVCRYSPLGKPVGEIGQLVNVHADGHAIICFAGGMVIINIVFLPCVLDGIGVEVSPHLVLAGVHAVLIRHEKDFRVAGLHLVAPAA